MKYINKFSTDTDYQAFTGGNDYVTPNVCYIEETDDIVMKPFDNVKTPIIFYTVQTIYNIKTSHTALYGMTWNDWINSEYYTSSSDGYFREMSGVVIIEDSELKNSNGVKVYFSDTIIPDETYTFRGTR